MCNSMRRASILGVGIERKYVFVQLVRSKVVKQKNSISLEVGQSDA